MFIDNNFYNCNKFVVPTQHIDMYLRDNRERKYNSYKRKEYNDMFQGVLDNEIDKIIIRENENGRIGRKEWRWEG